MNSKYIRIFENENIDVCFKTVLFLCRLEKSFNCGIDFHYCWGKKAAYSVFKSYSIRRAKRKKNRLHSLRLKTSKTKRP